MTTPPLPELHAGAAYRAGEVCELLQTYGQQCVKAEQERILSIIYLRLQQSNSPTWEQDWIGIKSHVRYGK